MDKVIDITQKLEEASPYYYFLLLGSRDYERGIPVSDNPYAPGSIEADRWSYGWWKQHSLKESNNV